MDAMKRAKAKGNVYLDKVKKDAEASGSAAVSQDSQSAKEAKNSADSEMMAAIHRANGFKK